MDFLQQHIWSLVTNYFQTIDNVSFSPRKFEMPYLQVQFDRQNIATTKLIRN